jgi:hypothetical protein
VPARARCARAPALALVANAGDPPAQSTRLEELKKEIDAREAHAKSLGQQAEGYLGELEAVDRELSEVRKSAVLLRAREKEASAELVDARRGVDQSAHALAETERGLEKRLVALYKWELAGGGSTIFTPKLHELHRRREGLARPRPGPRALRAPRPRPRRVRGEPPQRGAPPRVVRGRAARPRPASRRRASGW